MRMGLWILGAEVFAVDFGRSPQAEEESAAASGGQFELGFQPEAVEAKDSMDEVLYQLRRLKRPPKGDSGPTPMGIR